MILYTMMPEELIFPIEVNEFGKQKIVDYDGLSLLVRMEEGQVCTVLRVMSSNPNDFLKDKYAPGSKITLTLQ